MFTDPRAAALSFLEKVDRFLGWLKKPFARKPAFFIHQFLGLFFLFDIGKGLYSSAQKIIKPISRISHFNSDVTRDYLWGSLFYEFLIFIVNILLLAELVRFYKYTRRSWIIFSGLLLLQIQVIFTNWALMISGHFTHTYWVTDTNRFAVSFLQTGAWLCIYLLLLGLLTRKKIQVLHHAEPADLKTASIWMLIYVISLNLLQILTAFI